MPEDSLVERFHGRYGRPAQDFPGIKELVEHVEKRTGREIIVGCDFFKLVPLRGKVLPVVRTMRRPSLVKAIFAR